MPIHIGFTTEQEPDTVRLWQRQRLTDMFHSLRTIPIGRAGYFLIPEMVGQADCPQTVLPRIVQNPLGSNPYTHNRNGCTKQSRQPFPSVFTFNYFLLFLVVSEAPAPDTDRR